MTSMGKLLLWGDNTKGQLGQDDNNERPFPVPLGPPYFLHGPVGIVSCGCQHTIILTRTGVFLPLAKEGKASWASGTGKIETWRAFIIRLCEGE